MSGIDPALLAEYFRHAKGDQLDRILADATAEVRRLDDAGQLDEAAFAIIRGKMAAKIDEEAHQAIEALVIGALAVYRARTKTP